jgi:hypothetical protein
MRFRAGKSVMRVLRLRLVSWATQDQLAWMPAHLLKYVPAEVAESRVRDFADGPLVGTPEQIAQRLTQLSQMCMT